MRLGIITDVHLGPVRYKDGKPAKLTGFAEPLAREVVQRWRERHRPALVINLGDVLEDESRSVDLDNYRLFCSILDQVRVPALHVAGNHDQAHLSDSDLVSLWRFSEHWPQVRRHGDGTAYSVDHEGYRFIALSTRWAPPEGVFLGEGQLDFLDQSLGGARGPCIVLTHQSASDMRLTGNHWFEREPHMCLIHERAAMRRSIERHGNVLVVFNGHAHWNNIDVIGGVPYITLQSLTENIGPVAQPTPAGSYALVDLSPTSLHVEILGGQPLRFSWQR